MEKLLILLLIAAVFACYFEEALQNFILLVNRQGTTRMNSILLRKQVPKLFYQTIAETEHATISYIQRTQRKNFYLTVEKDH